MARQRKARTKARPKASRNVSRPAPDGSELCLQCGLCCDGTLFVEIRLQADEGPFVESLGLEVRHKPDLGPTAPQPCPAFVDGCCSLYLQGRPQTCHAYRCAILTAYTAGDTSLDDALATIGLARSLAREVEIEMGLPLGAYNRATLAEYLREHEPWTAPAEHARFLVAHHRLHQLGERYFGYQAKPAEVEAAAAGARLAAEANDAG